MRLPPVLLASVLLAAGGIALPPPPRAAAAPAAPGAPVKDPAFEERLKAFKKALRPIAEPERIPNPPKDETFVQDSQFRERQDAMKKESDARAAAVGALAGTRDHRVVDELIKALPGLDALCQKTAVELEEATVALERTLIPWFEGREDHFRRTGGWPTMVNIAQQKSIDALSWARAEAAHAHDVAVRMRDGAREGIGTALALLGEERESAWKSALKLGRESKNPEDRAAFCAAARVLDGPEVEAALLELEAKDPSPAVVVAAMGALAERASAAAFPRLRARLADADTSVAIAAIRGVARYRHAETIPALVARLTAASGRVFEDLVETLFELTGKHLPDTHAAWDQWWTAGGKDFLRRWDPDPSRRIEEIENIGLTDPRLIDVPSELAALLPTETDAKVRDSILENLSIHKSDAARRALLRALWDRSKATRIAAIRGLAHYRHPSVPQELIRRVPPSDDEELGALFTTLRTLWGGPQEFAVERPGKEALLVWWDTVKNRVQEQFLRVGGREALGGRPVETPTEGEWKDRNFYGLKVMSARVLFVVDVSLSMEEPAGATGESAVRDPARKRKIDVAKSELTRVLRSLPDGTLFGLVLFSVQEVAWENGMVPMNAANRDKALKWVEALKTKEATNVYDALETAFLIGTPRSPLRAAGAPDTIFFVSDGAPTAGKFKEPSTILEHVRSWNRTRGVKIHVVGVGEDHDVLFCRTLAEENGGTYVAR